MRSTAVLLLVALGLAVQLALAAPPPGVPVIKIGRTISNCGFYALEAVPVINGVHFWYEWMNKTSNFLFENNNTTYYLDLVEYNDASDTTLINVLYRTLVDVDGVVATFGPWSTALTTPAIQRTAQSRVPFLFTAGAPALYSSGYNHSFGMFVTGLERAIPCFNLFQSLGAKSAVIIASSDPFQQSLVAPTVTRLTNLGITVGLNYTAVIGTTDFTAIAQQVAALDPDLVVAYLESALYGPFLRDLREAQKTDGRPAAILNSNGGAVASSYALEDFRDFQWALDGVYGATQWSPFLQFFDNVFGSTEAFAEQYQQRFGYQPDFVDALAVMSGFVMLDALERTATFTSADIIAALRATRFTDSIVGPISFLGSGKINSTGLCVQLRPPSDSNVSTIANPDKDARVMLPVAPTNLAIVSAVYPITVDRPPGPKYTRSQKIGIIVGSTVAGVIVLAVLIGVAVYLFNRRYHVLFFARDGVPKDANEW